MSLLLSPGIFFGLEAGQLQDLQAYRVQPNTVILLITCKMEIIIRPQFLEGFYEMMYPASKCVLGTRVRCTNKSYYEKDIT